MPLVIADRVRETTLTSGTGTLTLAGPYSGFQAFSVIGNGNTTYYAIIDAQNGAWEVGIGAYTSSGNTLSRATVLASSNAGSLVNFGTGTKDVILTQPARRSVLVQEGGSGLITGVAAFTANGVPYADSTSTLATSANMTFNGTRLTVADLADSGLTSGRVVYVGSGSALVDSANLTFDGTTLTANALTTTSTVTINGGTANGVAYLNGSKVLTTGSALQFDGTNLGLGVTPSAWGSLAGGAFQNAGNGALYSLGTDNFRISQNVYFTTTGYTPRYVQTRQATEYRQDSGTHAWYTAPSGTAGNAISFTQAMTLTATGNVLVGTTTDNGYRLALHYASGPYVTDFYNSNTSTNQYNVSLWRQGASSSAIGYIGTGGSTVGNAAFANSFVVGTQTSSPLVFNTGDAERARIDSSGNLLVGKTTASPFGAGSYLTPSGSWFCSGAGVNFYHVYDPATANVKFYVTGGGTINAVSTTITAISDQRLKENVQDLDVGLDKIMALKPRKFDWKEGKGKNIKGDCGWIAQEFEQVFPDMVDEWLDPAPEGEEPYKSVRADLIPVLVKAIQEQQALIQTLTARVAALESN